MCLRSDEMGRRGECVGGWCPWILGQIFSAIAKQLIWNVAIDFCLTFWVWFILVQAFGAEYLKVDSPWSWAQERWAGPVWVKAWWVWGAHVAPKELWLWTMKCFTNCISQILPSRNWGRNSKWTLSYTAVCRDWCDIYCMCKAFLTVFKFRGLKIDYGAQSHCHPIRCFL